MSTLFTGIALFVFSSTLSLFLKKRIEDMFAFSILGIIGILYLSGLFGNLEIGFYSVIILFIFSFIYWLYLLTKNRTQAAAIIFTPGLFAFCIFEIIVLFGHQGRLFSSWDEFSHWGLVIKNMVTLNQLGNAPNATTVFRGYPPAVSLFSYFWIKLSGFFNESDAFRSSNIFLFCLFLPFFKNVHWKNWGRIIALIVTSLLLPSLFNTTSLTTIYVDILLGFFLAFILFQYFTGRNSRLDLFFLCISFLFFPLIKASGTGIGLIAILIIGLDIIFVQTQWDIKKKFFWIFSPVVSLFTGKYSWDIYLLLTKTKEAWNTNDVTVHNILQLILGRGEEYQKSTIISFFKGLIDSSKYNYGGNIKISVLSWVVLFAILSICFILLLNSKDQKQRFSLCLVSLHVGFCIYALSLLLQYVFTFSAYESENLASFTRYLSTYLTGMYVFLIGLFFYYLPSKVLISKINVCYILTFLIILISNPSDILSITLSSKSSISSSIELRRNYSISEDALNQLDPSTDKVYIVSQNDSGFNYVVMYYNFTPVNASSEFWSLGAPYYDGDMYTHNLSEQDLLDFLQNKGYTYMYIYKADDQFKALYSSLFENPNDIKDKTLFKIIMDGTSIKLRAT